MNRILLDIRLDRSACLHRQLHGAIASAIRRGDLLPGRRLPSTRALARHLGVSRNTVMNAYEELASGGLIVGRIGSGTRVAGKPALARRLDAGELLTAAHYPVTAAAFRDPEGNRLRLQG